MKINDMNSRIYTDSKTDIQKHRREENKNYRRSNRQDLQADVTLTQQLTSL